jgi:hypothetical protein
VPEPHESIDELLGAIRQALVTDATPELRARAAIACRAVLQHLEPQPAAPPPQPAPTTTPLPPEAAAFVDVLRGIPPEQLLDLAIARLRAAIPAGVDVPAVTPIRFHIIPVPPPKVPSR